MMGNPSSGRGGRVRVEVRFPDLGVDFLSDVLLEPSSFMPPNFYFPVREYAFLSYFGLL